MKKINSNTIVGIIITVFSVLGFFYVKGQGMKSTVGLSPGAYPQFLLIILGICGIVIIYESFIDGSGKLPEMNFKKVIPILVTFAAYITALRYIGFIISTTIFMAVAMYLYKEKRIKVLILAPVITSVVIYFLFTKLFLVPLP